MSPKKTIDAKKFSKMQKDAKLANSQDFNKYKKEEYYNTLKIQAEARARRVELAKNGEIQDQPAKPARVSKPKPSKTPRHLSSGKKNFRR